MELAQVAQFLTQPNILREKLHHVLGHAQTGFGCEIARNSDPLRGGFRVQK